MQFAYDINLMDGSGLSKLQELTNILNEIARSYGKDFFTYKSKTKVCSKNNMSAYIDISGYTMEGVISFKFSGATLSKDGTSLARVRPKIAMATSAVARLSRLWKSNFSTKYRLYMSLVV